MALLSCNEKLFNTPEIHSQLLGESANKKIFEKFSMCLYGGLPAIVSRKMASLSYKATVQCTLENILYQLVFTCFLSATAIAAKAATTTTTTITSATTAHTAG